MRPRSRRWWRRAWGSRSRTSDVVHGDTGRVPFGMGTYGSRSISVGGAAIMKALDKIEAKAKKIAAHLMEAGDADIEFANGEFTVKGTDKKIPFGQVALTAYVPHNYPLDKLEPGLNETAFYDPTNFTFPAGTYICEVEIDKQTGEVKIDRFTAVDDFGTIINPMIVEGQVHGGIVQGIGQALMENCVYDKETGQLLTGSFMDYAMPRAEDFPMFKIGTVCTPCTHNPLGTKGCGEAGAIGSPPAVINAVLDALAPLGVKDFDMPATPHRVWEAMRKGSVSPTSSRSSAPPPPPPKAAHLTHGRKSSCTHSPTNVPPRWPTPRDWPRPAAKPLAGGQTLLASMKLRLAQPGQLADLGAIKELVQHPQGRQQPRHRRHGASLRRRRERGCQGRLSRAGRPRLAHRRPPGARARHHRRFGGQQRSRPPAIPAPCWPRARRSSRTSAKSRPMTISRACSPRRWRRAN